MTPVFRPTTNAFLFCEVPPGCMLYCRLGRKYTDGTGDQLSSSSVGQYGGSDGGGGQHAKLPTEWLAGLLTSSSIGGRLARGLRHGIEAGFELHRLSPDI